MDEMLENEELRICKKINKDFCGELVRLAKNEAEVSFIPNEKMTSDENNIIHCGFVFNAAAFCAMAAVNAPNSTIIYSETKFLSPIELNCELTLKARALQSDLKKREVVVEGFLYNIKIYDAMFHIVVFDKNMFKIDFASIK